MPKKHQFHCEKCGNPCEIYKKGKKHRVLVCPECGVLATNPLPLLAGLVAGKAIKKVATKGLGLLGVGGGSATPREQSGRTVIKDERGKYEYKEKLLAEALR